MIRKVTYFTEQQLVEDLKSHKKNAFEYIYDRYAGALYNIIVHIVTDEQMAQDVLQDSIIKIWLGIGSYEPKKGTLFTWMLNITRNTAIDQLRSLRKLKGDIRFDLLDEKDLSYLTVADTQAGTLDIKYFVERLPRGRKILLEMVYFQGYTHEETAQRLCIPLGTVKSRIRSALSDLRKIYAVHTSL